MSKPVPDPRGTCRLSDVPQSLRAFVIDACDHTTRIHRGEDWEPCWKSGHACRKCQKEGAARANGYDPGWSVALPVGYGGLPDD